jgi:hypothetical protein
MRVDRDRDHRVIRVTPQAASPCATGAPGRRELPRPASGFRDVGFGPDIVDWIMEPGSDRTYRDQLDLELLGDHPAAPTSAP